jgi:hypothetical protein
VLDLQLDRRARADGMSVEVDFATIVGRAEA